VDLNLACLSANVTSEPNGALFTSYAQQQYAETAQLLQLLLLQIAALPPDNVPLICPSLTPQNLTGLRARLLFSVFPQYFANLSQVLLNQTLQQTGPSGPTLSSALLGSALALLVDQYAPPPAILQPSTVSLLLSAITSLTGLPTITADLATNIADVLSEL